MYLHTVIAKLLLSVCCMKIAMTENALILELQVNTDKLLLCEPLAPYVMIELCSNYAQCLLAVIMLNFMLAKPTLVRQPWSVSHFLKKTHP